jgi:tRNA threonylcarbamoyladenosine biosynthesis protein TsaE
MTSFLHMSSAGLKKISKPSASLEETALIGQLLSEQIKKGSIVAFFGKLGTGKTTVIKSLCKEIGGIDPNKVSSPTFTYLHIYDAPVPLFHFDLYRLSSPSDFLAKGFDEYFDEQGICLIEWAERIEPLLPEKTLKVEIQHLQEGMRTFTWYEKTRI